MIFGFQSNVLTFQTMFYFKLVALLLLISTFNEAKDEKKVTVMLSRTDASIRRKNGNSALQRLEVKILENFAKKYKITIDYIVTNETLNFVFQSKTRSKRFSKSAKYL